MHGFYLRGYLMPARVSHVPRSNKPLRVLRTRTTTLSIGTDKDRNVIQHDAGIFGLAPDCHRQTPNSLVTFVTKIFPCAKNVRALSYTIFGYRAIRAIIEGTVHEILLQGSGYTLVYHMPEYPDIDIANLPPDITRLRHIPNEHLDIVDRVALLEAEPIPRSALNNIPL